VDWSSKCETDNKNQRHYWSFLCPIAFKCAVFWICPEARPTQIYRVSKNLLPMFSSIAKSNLKRYS